MRIIKIQGAWAVVAEGRLLQHFDTEQAAQRWVERERAKAALRAAGRKW
ncbi:MAG: hypothetical protein AAFW98_18280 [Pseudomonadota bacterium]